MHPWKKRIRLVAKTFLGVFLVVWLVLFILHRSGLIKGLMNQYLSGISAYPISVKDAWIDLWGPAVELSELQLHEKEGSAPLIKLPRVRVDLGLNPFQESFLGPSRFTVDSGKLDIPLELIQELRQSQQEGQKSLPPLPEIWIRDLSLRLIFSSGQNLPLGTLSLALSPISNSGGFVRGRFRLPVGPSIPLSGILHENGAWNFLAGGELHFDQKEMLALQDTQNIWKQLNPGGKLFLWFKGSKESNNQGKIKLQLKGIAEGFSATIPHTPFRIRNLEGSFSLSSEDKGHIDLKGWWEETSLMALGSTSWGNSPEGKKDWRNFSCDLFLLAKSLPFDERIRNFTNQDRTLRKIWNAFEPEGRCDLLLGIKKDSGNLKPVLEPILKFQDSKITLHGFPGAEGKKIVGFPLPITSLQGEVFCQPGCISLHDIRGKMHGADFSLSGTLHGKGRIGIDLEIGVVGLALDQTTRKAVGSLPEQLSEIWDSIQPGGKTDLRLRLTKEPGPAKIRVSGKLWPQSMTAKFREFPLPLADIGGEITLDPGTLTVDVRGKSGDGDLGLKLALTRLRKKSPSTRPTLNLRIQGTHIAVDDPFRSALRVKFPGLYKKINPEGGYLDGEVWSWRTTPIDLSKKNRTQSLAQFSIEGVGMRQTWFPLALSEVGGRFFIESEENTTRVALDTMGGKALQKHFLFRYVGDFQGGENQSSEIQIRAPRLPLAPELFQAMEEAKISGVDFLKNTQWEGEVNFELIQRKNQDLVEELKVSTKFQNLTLTFSQGGIQLTDLTGALELQKNALFSKNLLAKIGDSFFEIRDLKILPDPENPTVSFSLRVPQLALDQDLENVFPPSIASKIRPFGLKGFVNADGIEVSISAPPGEPPAIEFQGPFLAKEISTQGGISIKHANAEILVETARFRGDEISIQGTLSHGNLKILGRQIEDFDGRFEITDKFVRLYEVKGTAYGGTLEQEEKLDFFYIALQAPNEFETNLHFANINMKDLLKDLFPRAKNLKGLLTVRLHLQGNHEDLKSLSGEGEIRIKNGSFWEVPVFGKIFGLFDLLEQRPVFSDGKVAFQIENAKFLVKNFELDSPLMKLSSHKGMMGFDGNLDLFLTIDRISGLPIIENILGVLTDLVFNVEVHGPLNNPNVSYGRGSAKPTKKEIYVPDLKEDPLPFKF